MKQFEVTLKVTIDNDADEEMTADFLLYTLKEHENDPRWNEPDNCPMTLLIERVNQ